MEESVLVRASLVISLLGLFGLMFVGYHQSAPVVSHFTYEGQIIDIKQTQKHAIIKLLHPQVTEIFLYKASNFSVKNGTSVVVEGILDDGHYADKIDFTD